MARVAIVRAYFAPFDGDSGDSEPTDISVKDLEQFVLLWER